MKFIKIKFAKNNYYESNKKFKLKIIYNRTSFKLFLIIIFICIYILIRKYFSLKKERTIFNLKNKNKIENKNKFNIYKNEVYYFEIKPTISIIIPYIDKIIEVKDYIKILKSFLNQSLRDIEIFISFKKINTTSLFKINKFFKKFKNIKIFKGEKDLFNDTISLILKSDANFITVFKNLTLIKDLNLFKNIYNQTYGKINYIYEYKIENEINYLIKNKIVKDIIDNYITFDDFNKLVKYIKSNITLNLNYISISYSIDNKYILYGYVSMISILQSKNYNTFISFYLIIPDNFTNENKNIIYSLYEKYEYFNITFIYIGNRYKEVKIINYLNQGAYYRLSLGELLPNLNKIIYLDCDVIVYKDLTNLYNTNFNNNLMLARKMEYEKKKLFKMNSGVLLLNLKKMREIKFEKNILDIINRGFVSKVQDQGLLIKYYFNQIGHLNEKYNIPTQGLFNLINYNKKNKLNYKNHDLFYILKYPTIRHFNGHKNSKYINSNDWWYFAKKGKYFWLILKEKNLLLKNIKI